MSELYPCISDYNKTNNDVAEENDGTVMVDLSGYIDPSTYIAQMIEAGIMLDQVRRGEYDYEGEDDEDDPVIDPLRAPWTDPADVDAFANGLKQSLDNKKAAASRAAANQQADAKASDHEQQYQPQDPPSTTQPPPQQTNAPNVSSPKT